MSAGRCPGLRKPLGFQPATAWRYNHLLGYYRPEWGNIFIAQGNTLGVYGYFTKYATSCPQGVALG